MPRRRQGWLARCALAVAAPHAVAALTVESQVASGGAPEGLTGTGGVPRAPVELVSARCPFEALLFAPPASSSSPMPLLLYLHGGGEMGGPLRGLLSEGATGTPPVELANGTAARALAEGFVVVAPHTSHSWQPDDVSRMLDCLLDGIGGLSLDRSRLYVTGHSLGGGGALKAASVTRRFAAAVPVAPSSAPAAEAMLGIPVWAFHGRNDVICPFWPTESLVGELLRLGADERDARLTLYEEAPAPRGWPTYRGHGSIIPAYATAELWSWLLSKALPSAGP